MYVWYINREGFIGFVNYLLYKIFIIIQYTLYMLCILYVYVCVWTIPWVMSSQSSVMLTQPNMHIVWILYSMLYIVYEGVLCGDVLCCILWCVICVSIQTAKYMRYIPSYTQQGQFIQSTTHHINLSFIGAVFPIEI